MSKLRLQMVKPTVISTFAGGGGSSLGYKWAGFKELLAIDFDTNSCETLRANFDFPVWQRDITTVTPDEILDFLKIKSGELDILDGSPPCQGFSTAGKRQLNDSRNDLFLDFVRLINGLQPKVFVMENVSGMIKGGYKGKFNEILQTLRYTGYNVKAKLLNAMWYEVPQSRERIFFIGVRKDLNKEPIFPKPLDTYVTVKDALTSLTEIGEIYTNTSAKFNEIVPQMREGQQGTDIKGVTTGYNMVKPYAHKPSPTITKVCTGTWFSGMIHPKESRLFTINEVKRLCSFPDNHKLIGTFQEQWARLGNAVMPKQMYHIAKTIKENILDV